MNGFETLQIRLDSSLFPNFEKIDVSPLKLPKLNKLNSIMEKDYCLAK